jgi:hypothetical protein
MRRFRLALIAAALSLSCASSGVQTDYDRAADFTRLKTYAWLDPPLREDARDEGGQGGNPFTHNTLIDKRVRNEVDARLLAQGYRLASRDEAPDFVVRYELEMREVVGDSPVSVGFGGGFGGGGGGHYGGVGSGVGYSPSDARQEATLILDVIDPATQQSAWRGWGTASARDDQIAPERLQELVDAILERFPPGGKDR